MPTTLPMNTIAKITTQMLAVISSFIAIATPTGDAHAHESHLGMIEVFYGPTDIYNISVFTIPVKGNFHMAVHLSSLDSNTRLIQPSIAISASGPQNSYHKIKPIASTNGIDNSISYQVDIPIEYVGEWIFTLKIEGSSGISNVNFPVDVVEHKEVNWGVSSMLILAFTPIIWSIASKIRQRHKV